jgi:predicted nucleic acid-binding protein
MELRFGSVLREDAEIFWGKVTQEIISRVNIVPITENEALIAGNILAELRKQGQIMGLEDVLIAASALANQYIVVTANIRHFSRIKGLKIENWIESV